jgi:ribulose-5-phosphate 4-epimerase/fuculose-1-phosphate aldolase
MALDATSLPSLKGTVSDEEWDTRVELAGFYRLVAKHDMDDLVGTHISARVPGHPDQFLINPYGVLFDEITASSLIKVNMDGDVLSDGPWPVNAAGFTIHHAVLSGRDDVMCAAHTHTVAGMAVSSVEGGLTPLTQKHMRFYKNIGHHPYEGIADDADECARLQRDLADHDALLLENHGLLTCGPSVRSAWALLYNLEKCCQTQVAVESTGAELVTPSEELCETTRALFQRMLQKPGFGNLLDAWESTLRVIAREDDSFMH